MKKGSLLFLGAGKGQIPLIEYATYSLGIHTIALDADQNAAEETFILRDFINPYSYKPVQELITKDFPKIKDLKRVFDNFKS